MEGIRLNKNQFEQISGCNLLELGSNIKGRQYQDVSEDDRKYFEGKYFNCLQLNDLFKEYLELLLTPDDKVWGLRGENTNYIGRSENIFNEAKRLLKIKEIV